MIRYKTPDKFRFVSCEIVDLMFFTQSGRNKMRLNVLQVYAADNGVSSMLTNGSDQIFNTFISLCDVKKKNLLLFLNSLVYQNYFHLLIQNQLHLRKQTILNIKIFLWIYKVFTEEEDMFELGQIFMVPAWILNSKQFMSNMCGICRDGSCPFPDLWHVQVKSCRCYERYDACLTSAT